MLHTVKTTCAISALLVSFAATAHAANVVSDPYASYIDCSYSQAKSSGNSGCTVRGQQTTVSALSQMMAAAGPTAIADVNYNNLRVGNSREYGNVQYERGTERGIDGKDREVKQLLFLVDPRPKRKDERDEAGRDVIGRDAAGRPVREGDIRDANGRLIKDGRNQPTASSSTSESSESTGRVYKIELSDAAAAQIEKFVPRKLERDEGVSAASRSGVDGRGVAGTWNDDSADENARKGKKEVVIPLKYASDDEIKAEEARLAKAAPAATNAVAVAKPINADQDGQDSPFKVMIVNDAQASDGKNYAIKVYNEVTSEAIYVATERGDAPVIYSVREVVPVTRDFAQWASGTPGENNRDQGYSGDRNTSLGSGESVNQPEPMDKDNPDSGKGGAGTLR